MKETDYIYVYNKKGIKQKMELVFCFDRNNNTYIVYKELDKSVPLYMAKTIIKEGKSTLDTDLSKKEQEMVIEVIKDYFLGGTDNV